MDGFLEIIRRARTLTFDCYGTLIDWDTGLRDAFRTHLTGGRNERLDEVFARYLAAEPGIQAGPYRQYRDVVAEAARQTGETMGLTVTPTQAAAVAESVGSWPPFPDTREALASLKQRFRLGILSNVDRDLFARTAGLLGVDFDFVVTAEDVCAYKPAAAHFLRFMEIHPGREGWLHVAQSRFHDGVPAAELGVPFVWINRRGERGADHARPVAEFADLASLARVAAAT